MKLVITAWVVVSSLFMHVNAQEVEDRISAIQSLHATLEAFVTTSTPQACNACEMSEELWSVWQKLHPAMDNLYDDFARVHSSEFAQSYQRIQTHKNFFNKNPNPTVLAQFEIMVKIILTTHKIDHEREYLDHLLTYATHSPLTVLLWRSMEWESGRNNIGLQRMLLELGAKPYVFKFNFKEVVSVGGYVFEKNQASLMQHSMYFCLPSLVAAMVEICPPTIVHEPFETYISMPHEGQLCKSTVSPLTYAFFSLQQGKEPDNMHHRETIGLLLDKGARISREPNVLWLPYFLATIPNEKTDLTQEKGIVAKVLAQHPLKKHVQLAQLTAYYHVQRLKKTPGSDWERVWGMMNDEITDHSKRNNKRVKKTHHL